MAEDTELERTEPATGRRISRAREDGQVAHSRELSIFIQLMAAIGAFMVMGGFLMEKLMGVMRHGLTFNRNDAFDTTLMWTRFLHHFSDALVNFLPLVLVLMLAALVEPLSVSGWNFTWKPLTPNFGKLNPIAGLKRFVSVTALIELVKSVLKATLIGGVGVWVIVSYLPEFFVLPTQDVGTGINHVGKLLMFTALWMISAFLLIAAIDLPYQLWEYSKKLRMTKEEVKQDAKDAEGDPQIKGRIRAKQREAARARMMAAVPKADVIVTNPTHFAVALRYDDQSMAAPQIIAKGTALIAERIMEIAKENNVPILEAPPLARALYRHADVGDEIPHRLYTAVAEVLAYVYQLKRPELAAHNPRPPRDLPVPADLDPASSMPEAAR